MPRPAAVSPSRLHPLMLVWQPCHPRSGQPLRFAVFRKALRKRLRAAVAHHRMALLDWLALPDGVLLLCDPGSLAQLAVFVAMLKSTVAADARRRHPDRPLWRGRYALTLVEPAALAQCVLTMDLAATAAGLVLHPPPGPTAAGTNWPACASATASCCPPPQPLPSPPSETPADAPASLAPRSVSAPAAMARCSPGPPPSP